MYICMVMTSICSSTVYEYGLQLIVSILWVFNGLCIKIVSQVEFQGVSKLIIDFLPLERIIVKLKPAQAESQDWWESLYPGPFLGISLLVAVLAE